MAVLGVGLLLILGGLVGHSLSEHLMARQIREQAALRREVGERRRAGCAGPPCAVCARARADNGNSSNMWTGG